jgi:hypothetical protein
VVRRTAAGKALGLIGASVSMLVWFFGIGAHPLASVLVIALDSLILYALTADRPYAGEMYAGRDVGAQGTMPTGRHFG